MVLKSDVLTAHILLMFMYVAIIDSSEANLFHSFSIYNQLLKRIMDAYEFPAHSGLLILNRERLCNKLLLK
jgi:hypothetical protein